MPSQTARRVASVEEAEELRQDLSKLHILPRAPFLFRNLEYVKRDRAAARRTFWDLSWATANDRRHLILTIHPTACMLAKRTAQQLLHPSHSLPRVPERPYVPRKAQLSISLVAETKQGTWAFGTRSVEILVWPEEHVEAKVRPMDISANVKFDLSAVVGVMGNQPTWLGLVVEITSHDEKAKLPNAAAAVLRGHIALLEEKENNPILLRDSAADVPMYFASPHEQPMEARRMQIDDNCRKDATINLALKGAIQDVKDLLNVSREKPKVHVQCRYYSKELEFWDGITRHDFLCPWCHRNCYRFRTLVTHLQVEHENIGFAVEGVPGFENSHIPMSLKFDVIPAPPKEEPNGRANGVRTPSGDLPTESVYLNPRKYKTLPADTKDSHCEQNGCCDNGKFGNMNRRPRADEDGMSTDSEGEGESPQDFVRAMRGELWGICKFCGRKRTESASNKYRGKDFCSEYCDVMYQEKMRPAADGNKKNDKSMLEMASVQREKKFDFQEAFGHLQLYHIVSVSDIKEEHYDPDELDSEDEVDQSWRLDLLMERVCGLEDVTPKEKLMWIMWNKFVHENYPIPSVYSERYTRYTMELFALEYGPQVKEKKLRVHFLGFLRALHTHGLIDVDAITSVMLCLDGRKKRRQCAMSSRPEYPTAQPVRTTKKTARAQRRTRKRS